jgi:hypothetical protein
LLTVRNPSCVARRQVRARRGRAPRICTKRRTFESDNMYQVSTIQWHFVSRVDFDFRDQPLIGQQLKEKLKLSELRNSASESHLQDEALILLLRSCVHFSHVLFDLQKFASSNRKLQLRLTKKCVSKFEEHFFITTTFSEVLCLVRCRNPCLRKYFKKIFFHNKAAAP